jgi:predicted house-cleaning noncanonical NTP pyrophosphatase (MazG superfamily)
MMGQNFSLLKDKIKTFSKKFYLNSFLKGTLLWFITISVLTILYISLEYFYYFDISTKSVLISIFLFYFLISFILLVVLPLLKYIGLFNNLSISKINKIIVLHFPDIKDKLLNIIELSQSKNTLFSDELIIASIEQKTNEIDKFKFSDAVSYKSNSKLLYFFSAIIFVSIFVSILQPNILKEAGYRIINYQKSFEKPSPYTINVTNTSLTVGKGDDFDFAFSIISKVHFENVSIIIGGKSYLVKNDSINFFSYKFKNLNNDIYFSIKVDNFNSKIFKIDILEKPILTHFDIKIIKPSHTQQSSEILNNITEIIVPEGSILEFTLYTIETDSVTLKFSDAYDFAIKKKKNEFTYKKQVIADNQLFINLRNDYFLFEDFLKINIKTVSDEFPTINVISATDSSDYTKMYFKGTINDDYGFSKLQMIIKSNDKIDSIFDVNFYKNITNQNFYFAYDFLNYKGATGSISYYFQVSDNDIINGSKSSVSELFHFSFPELKDILNFQDEQLEQIQNILSNSMDLTKQSREELTEIKKKLLNSDLTEWERREIEKSLLSKKKNIENEIQQLFEKSQELNNYMQSFSEQDSRIVEKQQQIQQLLEEVFSDELKKLLDEFNKLLQERNKEQLNDVREKLDISLDDLSKQLDKNLEILKRMQIEQKLDFVQQSLDEIIKKQQEHLENSANKNSKDISKEQEELKQQMDKLNQEYDKIQKDNNDLNDPMNLFDFKMEFDNIKNEFSNSIDNLNKENKKKSKESLSKNSDNLKNLKFQLDEMLESLFKQQNMENLEDLMQIVDNLVRFSFNQEDLIKATANRNFNNITFGKQKNLFNDFSIIKDSLYTLSEREPSLGKPIYTEIVNIQTYFIDIDKNFRENTIGVVTVNQQKVLTSANNLALFLAELIKKMQENMANSMPGNQNCNKPGSKPNSSGMGQTMKSMQKSLQQQLEKVMQMMKNGESGNQINNELGKAISQQETMQNMLQKMMSQGQVGSSAYETMKEVDQLLNKVKEDILRKNINQSTIERQKQIMTRLLQAEKAETEREFDEQRKSETAKQQFSNKAIQQFDNKNTIDNFEEKLIKNKLLLNNYYQKKYQQYVTTLDSINGENNKNRINN